MEKTTIKFSSVNTKERESLSVRAGDTVRVHQKIKEKDKTRIQIFEGLVISVKHGREPGAAFTVRKIASGVGVEKTFPLYSPIIDKIEIVRRAKSRRSKLYYIRDKVAKQIRGKMKQLSEFVPVSTDDFKVVEEKTTETVEETLSTEGAGQQENVESEEGTQTEVETKEAVEEKTEAEDKEPEKQEEEKEKTD